MHPTNAPWREGNPDGRARAGELLALYPSLTPEELSELLAFYNKAPAIDTALLTCDPLLVPKIARFEAEHRRQLRHEARYRLLIAVVAFFSAALVYALAMSV